MPDFRLSRKLNGYAHQDGGLPNPKPPSGGEAAKGRGRGPVATPTLPTLPYLGILERENREAGRRKEHQQRV